MHNLEFCLKKARLLRQCLLLGLLFGCVMLVTWVFQKAQVKALNQASTHLQEWSPTPTNSTFVHLYETHDDEGKTWLALADWLKTHRPISGRCQIETGQQTAVPSFQVECDGLTSVNSRVNHLVDWSDTPVNLLLPRQSQSSRTRVTPVPVTGQEKEPSKNWVTASGSFLHDGQLHQFDHARKTWQASQ